MPRGATPRGADRQVEALYEVTPLEGLQARREGRHAEGRACPHTGTRREAAVQFRKMRGYRCRAGLDLDGIDLTFLDSQVIGIVGFRRRRK